MSYTYERYERSTRRNRDGRSTLGYWVPLGLTVAAATLTLAAWVWSERHEDDDDGRKDQAARVETSSSSSDDDEKKGRVQQELGEPGALGSGRDRGTDGLGAQDASGGFVARMSGAIRRTPSPQQILDEASRRVVAGVAAAGAVVEGALSSIREEEQHDFGDHNRWSEETDARELGRDVGATVASAGLASGSTDRARSGPGPEAGASTSLSAKAPQHRPKGRRKTVAVVVSSESAGEHGGDDSYHEEDASILSHLPTHIDHEAIQLFVLIFAPHLKQHPLSTPDAPKPGASVTSSFSNIAHDDARTPLEEPDRTLGSASQEPSSALFAGAGHVTGSGDDHGSSSAFAVVYEHAQALVENNTMILPFATPTGHVHILRHLGPEIVYMQESLTGVNGDAVTHISGWVGQVIVVVGAEGGHGGLVDSDDEAAQDTETKTEQWWQKGDRVGLGKGVDVVDGLRIGEDWRRRVQGHD